MESQHSFDCGSTSTKDVGHFSCVLLFMLSLLKCSFGPFTHLLVRLLALLLNVSSSLHVLDINPLSKSSQRFSPILQAVLSLSLFAVKRNF